MLGQRSCFGSRLRVTVPGGLPDGVLRGPVPTRLFATLLMKHLWLLPVLVLSACAEGGKEDRPLSEVTVQSPHHLFALRSQISLGALPIATDTVVTQHGTLNLFDDSTYTLTQNASTSGADRYALATDGAFSIFVTGNATEPSTLFLGAYGQVANEPDYFFTDRVSTPNSARVGMFFGTRVVSGQIELEGDWHLLSLHTIFGQSLLSPSNIGRAAHGQVTMGDGDPGTTRTIMGMGFQGTSGLTFGGTVANLLDGEGNGDGSLSMSLSYQLAGQSADSRAIQSAATDNVIFGVDENDGDGEAGFVTMIRQFDAPTTPVDSVRVPGTFLVGGHTVFVNPSNAGTDAFVGVVTLTPQFRFTLDATGNSGADFTYTGTWVLADDGGMTITIDNTNETWFAAIDLSYNTFAFVDDFEELRQNNTPELNFGFGVRRKDT